MNTIKPGSVSSLSSSHSSGSNESVAKSPRRPKYYTAIVRNLPARYHSPKSIYDILKEYPQLHLIDIQVQRDGLMIIKSTEPDIVKKLKVLQFYIKEQIVISAPVPKVAPQSKTKQNNVSATLKNAMVADLKTSENK